MDKEIVSILKKYGCAFMEIDNKEMLEEIVAFAKEQGKAINCKQLKDKEMLSFEGFENEFYYKSQLGIYESKASGMFYNLKDVQKRYQNYCLRF